MNKFLRRGCLIFSIILLVFAIIRIVFGRENSGIFYLVAAVGFYIMYYSYAKSHRKD